MKFWTNRISTGNGKSFSDIVEKVAASRQQVKTASASATAEPETKVADHVEPANEDNKMRKNVHGPEGSPSDGNGEPEKDGEKKTVESQSVVSKPVASKPVAAKPQSVVSKPVATKPQSVVSKPVASKPVAAKPQSVVAKPAAKPQSVVSKPVAKPQTVPSLASTEAKNVKVAEEEAKQDGGNDGEGKNKGKFPEPDREQMYKQEPQEDGGAKTEKESKTSVQFVKIANLKPKAKAWLKTYWSMLYPSDYADAMTQDK